jgi:hypothetical protein
MPVICRKHPFTFHASRNTQYATRMSVIALLLAARQRAK